MVTGDNREHGGANQLQFCGAGAITMEEKENYAVLMRVAMLSALEAKYTTRIILLDQDGTQVASTEQLGRTDVVFLEAIKKNLQ